MSAFPKRLLLSLMLVAVSSASAGAAPTGKEIAQAIRDLGANRFAAREQASAFLRAAGQAAEPALREAVSSKDVEVARRAKEILEEFKWGNYPDTPPAILQQIRDYRGGNTEEKLKAVEALAKLGSPGYATLLKWAAAEEEPAPRALLMQFLAREIPRVVPVLLLDGKEETAERFLATPLGDQKGEAQKEILVRQYAAFLLQSKRLDAKIPHFQARVAKSKDTDAAWVLSYLFRAKGDLPAALQAAEKAKDKALSQLILSEEGDWKKLAKLAASTKLESETDVEALAFRAAYQRLAGQSADYEQTIAALRRITAAEPAEGAAIVQAIKALFLNDRPADALALLVDKKDDVGAFEVLIAQQRYREAFERAAKARLAEEPAQRQFALRQVEVLYYQLGEKEKAIEQLARLAETLPAPSDRAAAAYSGMIRTQLRLGRTEQALDFCARLLGKARETETKIQALELIFPQHGTSAAVWWAHLRKKHPGEKEAATLQRLRRLFAGKVIGEELAALAKDLEQGAKADKPADSAPLFLAIAEVCEAANAPDGAEVYLKKWATALDSPASWLRLGDYLAKHGNDRKEAAACYEKSFRTDMTQPLPLFLRGQILTQTGQEAEGRKLMELAHRLPLADEETRYAFAGALSDRGFVADSRREYELILRVGPGERWHTNEAIRHLAYDAMERKQYQRAADLFERFRLRCLRSNTNFVEYSASVHVPEVVHKARALAALQVGKFDEARRSADLCLVSVPGSIQLPIEIIAGLDKAGRSKDADEIFGRIFDHYEKRSAEYPKSASLHNSAAWVAALCRRKLEAAQLHAEKAVALAPDETSFLDTLAEVCFQRGNQGRAVKLMKRCRELEPTNDYYPRQLQRIEKGDPKAPLPDGAQ